MCSQRCKITSSGEQLELSRCVRVRQHCQQVMLKTAHNKLGLEVLNLTDHLKLCIQMRVPLSSHESSESRSQQNYSLPQQAKVWKHRGESEFLEQVRGEKRAGTPSVFSFLSFLTQTYLHQLSLQWGSEVRQVFTEVSVHQLSHTCRLVMSVQFHRMACIKTSYFSIVC